MQTLAAWVHDTWPSIGVLRAIRLKPAEPVGEEITEIAKLPPAKVGVKGWSAEADPLGWVIVFASLD
jgi:hypothetical protein